MIKVNELRVGNWVKPKVADWVKEEPNPYKIDLNVFYSMNHGGIREENLEPISLTPEILEKAGFEYDQVTFFKNDIHIGEFKSGLFLHSTLNKVSPKITSVHQLQNLYFALTGEELQIEL